MTDLYKQFAKAVGLQLSDAEEAVLVNKHPIIKLWKTFPLPYETIWQLAVEFLDKKNKGIYSINEEYAEYRESTPYSTRIEMVRNPHSISHGKTKSEALMKFVRRHC